MPSSSNTSPADRRWVSASRSRDITVSTGKNRLPGILSDEIIPQSRILYREVLPEKKTTSRDEDEQMEKYVPISNCRTKSNPVRPDRINRPVMNERRNSWWDLRRYRTKILTGSLQTIYVKTGIFFWFDVFAVIFFNSYRCEFFPRPFGHSPKRKSRRNKILICSSGYEAFCVILDVLRLLYSYTA